MHNDNELIHINNNNVDDVKASRGRHARLKLARRCGAAVALQA